MIALQLWLFGCSVIAIACLTSPVNRTRFIGCVVGLLGQPAWLASTFTGEQWGIFALSLIYTALYARGAWTHYGRL